MKKKLKCLEEYGLEESGLDKLIKSKLINYWI